MERFNSYIDSVYHAAWSKYEQYSGNMILDGTVPGARSLMRIEPRGEMIARDPNKLLEMFSGNDLTRKE